MLQSAVLRQMDAKYQKYNPFRTPSWRTDRALELVQHRPEPLRCSRKRDDEYIREYRSFLLKYFRCHTDDGRANLSSGNPGLFYAHVMHHHPDTEQRAIIQARLLAGLDNEQIAKYWHTLPETIEWYERLFFNVRDRLDAHDWVVKAVLGTAANRISVGDGRLTDNQRDMTYKLFAFFGGPLIFDVILSGFSAGNMPSRQTECDEWFETTFARLLTNRATQHARVFEVNKYNVMQLMEITCAIIGGRRAEREGGGPQNEVERNIEVMLEKLPWGLATRKEDHERLTVEQRMFSNTAVEPRTEEQFMLAAGQVPQNLIQDQQRMGQTVITVSSED